MLACDDMTNENFSDHAELYVIKSSAEVAWKVGLVAPISILAIFVNFIVIYLVCRSHRLKCSTYIFVSNVAMADILLNLYTPWAFLVTDLYQMGWSMFTCEFNGFIKMSLMMSRGFTIIVITLENMYRIFNPFRKRLTLRKSGWMLLCIWILAFGISIPVYRIRRFECAQWKDVLETFCYDDPDRKYSMTIYYFATLFILVYLPCICLCMAYLLILMKLRHYDVHTTRSTNLLISTSSYRKKIIKSMVITLSVSTMMWLPWQVRILYLNSIAPGKELASWYFDMKYVSHLTIFLNSLISPLIYGMRNVKFRLAFKIYFSARSSSKVSPIEGPIATVQPHCPNALVHQGRSQK